MFTGMSATWKAHYRVLGHHTLPQSGLTHRSRILPEISQMILNRRLETRRDTMTALDENLMRLQPLTGHTIETFQV
jgi:hypothetical protein